MAIKSHLRHCEHNLTCLKMGKINRNGVENKTDKAFDAVLAIQPYSLFMYVGQIELSIFQRTFNFIIINIKSN